MRHALALLMLLSLMAVPPAGADEADLASLVPRALVDAEARALLRAAGADGLAAVGAAYDHQRGSFGQVVDLPDQSAWDALFNEVGQQHLCRHSRLYWYTDLAAAEQAARTQGKPILSLHLLGRLTSEFSCANSRFFRTMLYADPAIAGYLREHVVLHWWTTRDVPQVTISFADGRRLRTTLTGNSVHYLLDADGRPFDALPGMYGPGAFLAAVRTDVEFAAHLATLPVLARAADIAAFHRQRLALLQPGLQMAAAAASSPAPDLPPGDEADDDRPVAAVPAARAAPLAEGKCVIERPLLRAAGLGGGEQRGDADWPGWRQLADDLAESEWELSGPSLALVTRQLREAGADRQQVAAVTASLGRSLARDTAYDEWCLHAAVHAWFIARPERGGLAAFNRHIYRSLFLTPADDPWMGLAPVYAYSGLDHGGSVLDAGAMVTIGR